MLTPVVSLVMMGGLHLVPGAILYGYWDGIRHVFFWHVFGWFAVMLLLMKAFDILCFDWFLLCHFDFFLHFYPEIRPYPGPYLFGYNRKPHLIQIVLFPA